MTQEKAGAASEETTGDTAALAPVAGSVPKALPPVHDRRDEEPRGRWEDRCDVVWKIAYERTLVCDRKTGHKGMHSGRIIADTTVIGYARRRA